jgi:hypothetical protein
MPIAKNGRSIQINCLIPIRTITQELTWQTAVDITLTHLCIDYYLAYLKYSNKYAIAANVTANVKFGNIFR